MSLRVMTFPFFGLVLPWLSVTHAISVVILAAIVGGYVLRDDLYSIKRKFAPWWDKFDTAFAVALGIILFAGYATFLGSVSRSGLWTAFQQFIRQSGLLALLTTFTAIIALYRLRHRPDKIRPAVREDFKNYDGEEPTDFGLRNYGPGPALYLQAAVEVVDVNSDDDDGEFDPATCLEVHENPIHLQEGEFASLVLERDDPWVKQMAEQLGTEESDDNQLDESLMVNLHYTYVSQSGAREPTNVTAERDDTDLLESADLIDRDGKPRRIKLLRVVDAVSSESSD